MNYYGFESNNEFNPLFEKMRERFCQNGTIADQLTARAAKYHKEKPKRVTAEQHMTVANFLPHISKGTAIKKRSFFSLKNINSACLLLLIAGTVLFSGAALGTLRTDNSVKPSLLMDTSEKGEENMMLFDSMPWEHISSDLAAEMENVAL